MMLFESGKSIFLADHWVDTIKMIIRIFSERDLEPIFSFDSFSIINNNFAIGQSNTLKVKIPRSFQREIPAEINVRINNEFEAIVNGLYIQISYKPSFVGLIDTGI